MIILRNYEEVEEGCCLLHPKWTLRRTEERDATSRMAEESEEGEGYNSIPDHQVHACPIHVSTFACGTVYPETWTAEGVE